MKCDEWITLMCAWVLWEHTIIGGGLRKERWDILAAFETKPSCEERAQLEAKRIEKRRSEIKDTGTPPSVVLPIKAICLPKTVDPRQ